MSDPVPSWADVLELVTTLDGSGYGDVDLQMPGLHLRMSTSSTAFTAPVPAAAAPVPAAVAPIPEPATVPEPTTAAPAPSATAVEVTTPTLGTFYRRPSPDAAPFVEIGSPVGPDTTVAIVEVMKLMNPVTAGVAGRLVEICAEDGDLVEHGQVLFRVEPDRST